MELAIEIIRLSIYASTPVLLAALGGLFTWHANVFNISMEGMLLTSAFAAIVGSYFFGSWIVGIIFGIIGSLLIEFLFSIIFFFHLFLKLFIKDVYVICRAFPS